MNIKLHRNTVEAVISILKEIFENGRYAGKAIEFGLKSNPKWGARDRAFIAEASYNIVRNFRFFSFLIDNQDIDKMVAVYLKTTYQELPAWIESALDNDAIKLRLLYAQQQRVLRESIPDWMDKLLCEELSEAVWENQIKALNEPADLWIRTNTLKIPVSQLQKLLPVEAQVHPLSSSALKIVGSKINLFTLPSFKEGFFEVQDLSSQLVAPFLRVEPGMRVVDACAGAGGKSLHLAALMENKGKIIALDTEKWKLDELRRRSRRAGTSIIESRPIESKTIKRLEKSADRLLLDVPCSGLGVLRRNPDAKWKLSKEFIERIRNTQAEILEKYSSMLRVGGLMVYATCSILPSENQQQVEKFLSNNQHFRWIESKTILPTDFKSDGFFMCLMERTA